MTLVFLPSEQHILTLPSDTTIHTFSKLKGLVALSQVRPLFKFSHQTFLAVIRKSKLAPHRLWARYGVRKILSCWYVKPSRFLNFYKTFLNGGTDWLDPADSQQLLAKQGIYYLADVCRTLAVRDYQIIYHMKKLDNPKKTMGVWRKSKGKQRYMVDMAVFGPWFKTQWLSGHHGYERYRK